MILHLFKKVELPKKLPGELRGIVNKLAHINNKEEYLQEAYNLFTEKYQGNHFLIIKKFKDLFVNDIKILVSLGKYQHCMSMNYLLRAVLITSGKFTKNNIKTAFSLVWYIFPHQYLKIRVSANKWINVDLWAKSYGIKFGNYARGFNT